MATRYWSKEDDAMLRLLHREVTNEEIAADLGRSEQAVCNRILRLGLAKAPERANIFNTLPREQRDWLLSVTPEGATIADTVRAIITDAYLDAKEEA